MKQREKQTQVLIEAEHFANLGGWTLDTEFVYSKGSPYLMADGLGQAVADAVTRVWLPAPGAWRFLDQLKPAFAVGGFV